MDSSRSLHLVHLESFAEGRGVFYSRNRFSPDLGLVRQGPLQT